MHGLRLLAISSLAALCSCTPPDSAIRVNVTVRAQGTARVRADCLRLTISSDTQELKSVTTKRIDDDAVFAVRRGSDLPQTVKVQASGFLGDCADEATLKLNAQGEAVTAVFLEGSIVTVDVFLDPPNAALDFDRDGYVSSLKGGLDCNDSDNTVFPGAGQICADTGDSDCDGQGGCDDTECGTAAVCADPPDRVVVTTAVTTMLRYECSGPFRVELHNALGPRVAIRDTPVGLSSSLAGVTVHGVATCNDAPLTSLPILYGQSFFEVYLKADPQAFGTTTLTGTAAASTPGSVMVEVHPQPVDHLEFTSPPRVVTAGQCSTEEVTLEFRDAMNRRTDVDSPTTVTLDSVPGDLNNANIFFSDAACASEGRMTQLLPGQGALSLHLKAGRAGAFTLTANPSAPMGASRTQLLTVQPGAATQLAFTNAPLVLVSTENCSAGELTVQLQDEFKNPVTTAVDVPVRLTVTGLAAVELFVSVTPPMCTSVAQTTFTISTGSSSVSMRARSSSATTVPGLVRAAVLSGPITDDTQELRVSAGFASKFTLAGSAQSPLAGVCSANPFTVELRDSVDNPASASGPVTFGLTTLGVSDPSFRFYRGAGCQTDLGAMPMLTVPAGQTSAQFYYRGNRAVAGFEIRASSTLTPPATFLPGNSIRPAAPGKLVFVAPLTQTAQAGVCTALPYLANVLDQFDNLTSFTAPQVVTVTSNPAGVTVGTSTCAGGSVMLATGATQVAFSAKHTTTTPVTPYTVTATVNGFSTVPGATLTVVPGPSTLQVDVPLNRMASVIAGACQQVTLTRRDAQGNNAPTAGATPLTLAFPASTVWRTFPSNNCSGTQGAALSMNSTHTVTFSVIARTAGTHQMSASIGSGATLQTALVDFQVAPAMPTLVFEVPNTGTATAAAAQPAAGCTLVTVARKDMFLNDVPMGTAGSLTFGVDPTTTVHSGTPCVAGNAVTTHPVGAAESRASFYVRATRSSPTGGPQAQTVTATLAGQTATLTLTVSPGAPTLRILLPTGAAATVTANQCVPVTVERRDPEGNLVPLTMAMNLTVAPAAGLELFGSTTCTTPLGNIPVTMGASTRAFSLRTNLATMVPLVLTLTLDSQPVTLTLTVNPGPTTKLVLEGFPTNLTARGCTGALVVRRLDTWNNNVTSEPGLTVTLASAAFSFSSLVGCGSPVSGATVTIANGSSISAEPLHATATLAGTATATASATAPSGPVTGSASSLVAAGPAAKLFLITPPGTVTAGACSTGIQVELRDADDNKVTPAAGSPFTVTLGSTPNAPVFFPTGTCTGTLPLLLTSMARVGTFSFRPTTAPAMEVVEASGGSLTPASQTWKVDVGPANKLAWKSDPTAMAGRFACVTAGAIQILDSSNNVVAAPVATTITPTATPGAGITFYADSNCLTPVTTVSIPATQSEAPELFMIATGGTTSNVSATAMPALTAAPVKVVTASGALGILAVTANNQDVEAGACVAMTIERQDSTTTPTINGTTTVNLTVGAASVTLYSTATCTGTPATSVVLTQGQSSATVYVRGRSANATATPVDVLLTATDPSAGSTAGAATLKVYPLVRRGACNLADTELNKRCPLALPIPGDVISRSFLLFSSKGRPATTGPAGMAPADQSVECHLENLLGVDVVCSRAGSNGAMSINYQVVSFGRDAASGGVSVQHQTFPTTAATTTATLTTAVDTAKSFILASNTMAGVLNDGDGFPIVRFPSTGAAVGTVDVVANTAVPARTVSLQVVTLGVTGAAVDHQNPANPAQSNGSFTIGTTTTPTASTFALAMARVTADSTNANYMCKRRFNVKVGGANVTLRRGGGGTAPTNCTTDAVVAASVQRVTIPGTAVTVPADVTFNNNTTATQNTASFTAVATHKAVTFLMMQGPGGQSSGEANYQVLQDDGDDTGPFHALLDFNGAATQVTVTRETPSNTTSVFSPVVVQFDP